MRNEILVTKNEQAVFQQLGGESIPQLVCKLSATWFWGGARRQNFRFPRTYLLAGNEPYGCGPGGKKIDAGKEFRRRRRQECPMPSEQTNHHEGDNQIEYRVGGGYASFNKEWERGYLEDIGGYGYGPRHAVLGLFQRFEVIEE